MLELTSVVHLLAETASSNTNLDIIAWIGIPLFLAFCGAVFGIVKGSIRFAQYMAKSEEAQIATAKSNNEINEKLDGFIDKTNARLNEHDADIAVLKYVVDPNSKRGTSGRRVNRTSEASYE